MSQLCQVLCVRQESFGAEYETVVVTKPPDDHTIPGAIEETEIRLVEKAVAESPITLDPTVVNRAGTLDAERWSCEPNNNHLSSNGLSRSATLPNRRHTAHVSFGSQDTTTTTTTATHNTGKYSILKSPAKAQLEQPLALPLGPAGRIAVIKEEVEVEVATNSRCTAIMHRSVEGTPFPAMQSSPGAHEPAGDITQLQTRHSTYLQSDRNTFPIYSEPVIAPKAFGNKLRADYYDSQGSHQKFLAHFSDDDPGVMSEADTTSTGFRRGGKARASLPIVRTPSKTLEKPLGLVFLQFRDETKRAVLPNEITTLDTVKALFVRAFPKVLTMEYLDRADQRKIYILDQRKDMFYELEDLRDIRDRSVLKILEADQLQPAQSVSSQLGQLVDEINYFSEPEFDSLVDSLRHTGSHSAKVPRQMTSASSSPYKLIRPGSMSRSYPSPVYSAPPVPPKPQRSVYGCYTAPLYEEPLYANTSDHKRPPSRSGTATPIVDEEARYRVDAMERHLANLTGLVQQALTGNNSPSGTLSNSRRPSDSNRSHSDYANVYISPKRPIVQQKEISSTSNGPVKLTNKHHVLTNGMPPSENGIFLKYPDPMLMEYLENVQHKIRDMLGETQALRRHHQSQAMAMREIIKQNFDRLKSQFNMVVVAVPTGGNGASGGNNERRRDGSPRTRSANEMQAFQQDATRLSRDVISLETTVEKIKSGADDQKIGVRLRDVERYTTELNELSGALSDLRLKFPGLQENLKAVMNADMEGIIKDEMFIKEEPVKLDDMARRCKKLTGTLLNLNKLVSLQDYQPLEQEVSVDGPLEETPQPVPPPPERRESLTTTDNSTKEKKRLDKKAQNVLDDLLSELEVFTDMSSRENTPDRDSTIKRSPRSQAKSRGPVVETNMQDVMTSLSPPSITPSNSSQSTNTTMSSMTDNSSIFSGSDSGTTISKLQVGVGEMKTIVSPVPTSGRSSGFSTPARKSSDAGRNLSDWLSSVSAPPPPPPRGTSKSPINSPLSKTGGFFTLPHYGRTVSEPGDFDDRVFSEYANLRELRSPLKDQRLTPQQQDKIGSYYTSKLRKGSDPGTGAGRSLLDDLSSGFRTLELTKTTVTSSNSRVSNAFLSKMEQREPPALPPKPGQEDSNSQNPPPLPPRNRQEILEERHQELLKKQKQLQEQYARLQQLQRDQKTRPVSPINKASTSPQSGSLTDLKRHQQTSTKMNGTDIYATPTSKPLFHQMNITNGSLDAKTIFETDIL